MFLNKKKLLANNFLHLFTCLGFKKNYYSIILTIYNCKILCNSNIIDTCNNLLKFNDTYYL